MAAAEGGRRLAPEEFLDPCWPGADFIPSSSTKSLVVCVCVLSRIRLFSDPMECSPPGSSVHGISLARILEWVAVSSYRDLPYRGSNLGFLHCRQILYH